MSDQHGRGGGGARRGVADEDIEYGRPATPYHIIEILLNAGGQDRLPGVNLHRVEMLRRRSASSADDPRQYQSGGQGQANIISVRVAAENRKPTPRLTRQTTLALLTLDDEETRVRNQNSYRGKRRCSDDMDLDVHGPPPPYNAVAGAGREGDLPRQQQLQPYQSLQYQSRFQQHPNMVMSKAEVDKEVALEMSGSVKRVAERNDDLRDHGGHRNDDDRRSSRGSINRNMNHQKDLLHNLKHDCCCWPWFLKNRPVLRLFLVITFNGLVSMMCAAIFIELERPDQLVRLQAKEDLRVEVDDLRKNLSSLLRQRTGFDSAVALDLLANYSDKLVTYTNIPDEIEWEMLAASAFVTSVSSTTGYGDIVPVTLGGKIFTLVYALYGIPIFIWYIVKLGALFRAVTMRIFHATMDFLKTTFGRRARMRKQLTNVFLTVSGPVQVQPDLSEEFQDEKRFHPSVIGVILVIFLASVAAFISYMEGITYFDAFYACFITYSTIGFGDIDIYRISYRSNWFNLMIYGNGVHVIGYMMISAWISSILDKCGIRKY